MARFRTHLEDRAGYIKIRRVEPLHRARDTEVEDFRHVVGRGLDGHNTPPLTHETVQSPLSLGTHAARIRLGDRSSPKSRAYRVRVLPLEENHVVIPAKITSPNTCILERVVGELMLVEDPAGPASLHGLSPGLIDSDSRRALTLEGFG